MDLIDRQAAIDALACLDDYEEQEVETLRKLPSAQPTDDSVEVVRCKDCAHAQAYNKRFVKPIEPDKWWCFVWEDGMDACDYCSRAERRAEDEHID